MNQNLTLLLKYRNEKCLNSRNKLIENYLPYVEKIVNLHSGYSRRDLKQEGALGVLDAIEKYKEGGHLNACVFYWVRKRIFQYKDEFSLIKIPSKLRGKIKAVKKLEFSYKEAEGAEPDIETLCNKLKYTRNIKRKVQDLYDETYIPLHQIKNELDFYYTENTEIASIVSKPSLAKALDSLTDKEKFIIYSRYGFNNVESQTFKEVSLGLNVTLQRIQQMEKKILLKLKKRLKFQTKA